MDDDVLGPLKALILCHPVAGSPGQHDALCLAGDLVRDAADAFEIVEYTDRDIETLPNYLSAADLDARYHGYGDTTRRALVATVEGATDGPTIVLNGHIDVEEVPDPWNWTAPHGWRHPVEVDGTLVGRGAADTLGGVVGLISVFRTLAERKQAWRGKIVLQLVVDEEIGGSGTLYLLSKLEGRPVGAILAEPTSSLPCNVTRSFEQFAIRCSGSPRHMTLSRYRDNACNAIPAVLDVVEQTNQWCIDNQPGSSDGARYIMIGQIKAGTDSALPAASATLYGTMALPPRMSSADVLEHLRTRLGQRSPFASVVEACGLSFPASGNLDGAFISAFDLDTASKAREFPSACDARLFEAADIPSIVLGPGSLAQAHAANEHAAIDEILSFPATLERYLQKIVGV